MNTVASIITNLTTEQTAIFNIIKKHDLSIIYSTDGTSNEVKDDLDVIQDILAYQQSGLGHYTLLNNNYSALHFVIDLLNLDSDFVISELNCFSEHNNHFLVEMLQVLAKKSVMSDDEFKFNVIDEYLYPTNIVDFVVGFVSSFGYWLNLDEQCRNIA